MTNVTAVGVSDPSVTVKVRRLRATLTPAAGNVTASSVEVVTVGVAVAVPVGVPGELLRRRPDIRRAERQLAAATATVGTAIAALYPQISLTGNAGYEGTHTDNLFLWSNRFYALFPSLTLPLFDAGRIGADIDASRERARQAALAYRATVLGALREVEDSLAAYRTDQQRHAALVQAAAASRRSVDLARAQYAEGVITVLAVLDAQRSLLVAEDAVVRSDQAVTTDLMALYKALGGGWETTERPPAAGH